MSRIARIVVPDVPHHVTQRGNSRQVVFRDDQDRNRYMTFIRENARATGVKVLAYALMPNHVHHVVVPPSATALAEMFRMTHLSFARVFNRRYGKSGHVWQNRYFSCAMEPSHCYRAMRYVELNPLKARLCNEVWGYVWSSAAYHCGLGNPDSVLDTSTTFETRWGHEWNRYLEEKEADSDREELRYQTASGRPWGGEQFLKFTEEATGRVLLPARPTEAEE